MTSYHTVVADRKDLAVVTVICPKQHCGAKASFDATGKCPPVGLEPPRDPLCCPCCETPFSDSVLRALRALIAFHEAAAQAEEGPLKTIFQFEIRQPE